MSFPVVFRAEAPAEFDEAFDWYERQRRGLGIDFADRLQETLDRIATNPFLHAEVFADIRKAGVKRFPYFVFYRPNANQLEVIAIFHSHRDPSIWQGRA